MGCGSLGSEAFVFHPFRLECSGLKAGSQWQMAPLPVLMQGGSCSPESLPPPFPSLSAPPHRLHLGTLPLQPCAQQTASPPSSSSFYKKQNREDGDVTNPFCFDLPPCPPAHRGLWNGGSDCPSRGHGFSGRQSLPELVAPYLLPLTGARPLGDFGVPSTTFSGLVFPRSSHP